MFKLRKSTGSFLFSITTLAALLSIAVGAVFERTRISLEELELHNATHSAALAIGADDRANLDNVTESERKAKITDLENFAKQVILQNYNLRDGKPDDLKVLVTITDKAISVKTQRDVFTAYLGIAGKSSITIYASSEIEKHVINK